MDVMASDSREMKGQLSTIKIEGYILEIYILEMSGTGHQISNAEAGRG